MAGWRKSRRKRKAGTDGVEFCMAKWRKVLRSPGLAGTISCGLARRDQSGCRNQDGQGATPDILGSAGRGENGVFNQGDGRSDGLPLIMPLGDLVDNSLAPSEVQDRDRSAVADQPLSPDSRISCLRLSTKEQNARFDVLGVQTVGEFLELDLRQALGLRGYGIETSRDCGGHGRTPVELAAFVARRRQRCQGFLASRGGGTRPEHARDETLSSTRRGDGPRVPISRPG